MRFRAMSRAYWLIKSEPSIYSFSQLVADGSTRWDGIRNYEARNNLRAMKFGDYCLFYHSNEGKEVVGVACVSREAYADPSTHEDWSVVDIEPLTALKKSVTLEAIRSSPELSGMALIKKSRLSVVPVTKAEFVAIVARGATKLR